MLERMYGITPQEELPPVAPEIPDLSISIQENEEAYGRFVAEPLERGWVSHLATLFADRCSTRCQVQLSRG